MAILDVDPQNGPEAAGTLQFYRQGQDPSTGFTVTSDGVLSAPGGVTGPVTTTTLTATSLALTGAAASTVVETAKVTADANPRLAVTADGTLKWGGGTLAADCVLDRYAAGGLELNCALRFTNGQLLFGPAGDVDLYWGGTGLLKTDNNLEVDGTTGVTIGTAGGGLKVKEGTNATMGTGTLNGTTAVVVSTTKVTATSRIFLSIQAPGGTPSGTIYVSARTAGTSFSVKSAAADTSTFAWMIVEPA